MSWPSNPEDREAAPLAVTAIDRDEAIRWARELIAQGVKVVRLRSAGRKAKADEPVGQPPRTDD